MPDDESNLSAASNPGPPPSPLDEIVDDVEVREDAIEWSRQQLHAGRTVEEIAAELVTGYGWDEDDALGLVEEVRKLSRGERGILTRETIAAIADREYHRGGGGWITGFPTLAAARRLVYSIGSFRWLWRVGRKR